MNQETENLLFLLQPNLDWNCSCITAFTLGETIEFEVEVAIFTFHPKFDETKIRDGEQRLVVGVILRFINVLSIEPSTFDLEMDGCEDGKVSFGELWNLFKVPGGYRVVGLQFDLVIEAADFTLEVLDGFK
jgi:hypothetical protein